MNKLISIILIFVLVLSLCACSLIPESGRETEVPSETERTTEEPTTESTTEESTTEESTTEAEAVLSAEEQIALFVANRDLWYPQEEYYVPYTFAVTDLDQNGRLEILINICMGTGFFSQNAAWEVNEAGDGIVKCSGIFDTYDGQPDIAYTQMQVYDAGNGIYYYIVSDYQRNGWEFNVTNKYAISLSCGQIYGTHLGTMLCENYSDGTQTISYVDSTGAEITEDAFETLAESVYADLTARTAQFLWQNKNLEELEQLDADGLHHLLEQSWAGFSLN